MKYVLQTAAPARRPPPDFGGDLDPEQRAVAEAPPGRILVLAGAGTGKTRALTYRMAKLVLAGCPPERILLCTFTNRAAREMTARVEALLATDMRRCPAGTFHHVGNRLLRRFAPAVGLEPDFGILDSEDARTLLAQAITEVDPRALTMRRFPRPKVLHALIGLASGMRRPLAEIVGQQAPQLLDVVDLLVDVARRYGQRKTMLNVCDFDDLVEKWHALLTDDRHAHIAAELRGSFDHVLIDEYQDINLLQGEICDRMAEGAGSMTCVGDDAQAIYGFRGADFRLIRDFGDRHRDARILQLTTDYRSTPEIVGLANRSIACNRDRHPKDLVSPRAPGAVPALIPVRDVFQQAEFVAQRVLELHHDRGAPLSKMAVLYRNHSHGIELQIELGRRGIPFSIRSGLRFFEQAHVKDVLAYLRIGDNPRDELAWRRLLPLWPGIGQQTTEALVGALLSASRDRGRPDPRAILTAADPGREPAKASLAQLGELLEHLDACDPRHPGEPIRLVVEAHYRDHAERTYPNADARLDDLEHLALYADHHEDVRGFLAQAALAEGIGAESLAGAREQDDRLILTTIHQAKGLEWPICFLLHLCEGRFPGGRSGRLEADLEEERRLFYVAVTRTADELYLLVPTTEENAEGRVTLLRPSRFLVEIDRPPAVFERWQIEERPLA